MAFLIVNANGKGAGDNTDLMESGAAICRAISQSAIFSPDHFFPIVPSPKD